MSLHLVPYSNAMRLGQGFNSYTQQICIDDAVVISPDQAENTLLNDGTTMRNLVEEQGKSSVWTNQNGVAADNHPETEASQQSLGVDQEVGSLLADGPEGEHDGTPQQTGEVQLEDDIEKDTQVDTEQKRDDREPMAGARPTREIEPESRIPRLPINPSAESGVSSVSGNLREKAARRGVRSVSVGTAQSGTTIAATPSPSPVKDAKSPRRIKFPDSPSTPMTVQIQADEEEREALRQTERERIQEQLEYQKRIERKLREEDRKRREEERNEQRKIREERRQFEETLRKDFYESYKTSASNRKEPLSLEELKTFLDQLEDLFPQDQSTGRLNGIGQTEQDHSFDANEPRGPSQTVTYTSRFIDRLSDITDDMCISGALSIKAARIGGSGRGSFIDSDKFKESDLTYYISVKVVNQTMNFKDALQFKPIKGLEENKNPERFVKVYGDSFISGFLEGGEFNALVSMKILNKAEKTDIRAAAKVAFTTGPMSTKVEASVGSAREKVESSTETTIQVSWCGGGHIKPMEQKWDIKSLMQAASRFPNLVADCPQRTYAIITKYDTLRSFIDTQPLSFSNIQYENAQLYTNMLMDSFMTYKALYKQVSDQIFQVRKRTMEIEQWKEDEGVYVQPTNITTKPQTEEKVNGFYPYVEDKTRFEANLDGLDLARKAIRLQMSRIVNEVDEVERKPTIATEEDRPEPFQAPTSFEMRLPRVSVPKALRCKHHKHPLTGARISSQEDYEEGQKGEEHEKEHDKEHEKEHDEEHEGDQVAEVESGPALFQPDESMEPFEIEVFDKCTKLNPTIGKHLQATRAYGAIDYGTTFNNLEFIRKDWHVRIITVGCSLGMINLVGIEYDNGLTVQKGPATQGQIIHQLGPFEVGERIVSGSIETGNQSEADTSYILSLRLFTNRGRSLLAEPQQVKPTGDKSAVRDGVEYQNMETHHIDCPFVRGTLKGFFGRSDDALGVSRLGFIWGDILPETEICTPNGVSKLKRKTVPSMWGQTACEDNTKSKGDLVHTSRFGVTYPSPPNVIFAFSEVRGHTGNRKPVSWKGKNRVAVSKDIFSYTTTAIQPLKHLSYSWLSLPDNEVNFNTGIHDFDSIIPDDQENALGSYNISFEKPYQTVPATPAIWCITLDYSGRDACPEPKLTARVRDLTKDGFKLVIETWGGSRHAGNVWGWCTWDKEFDGVKVKAGKQLIGNGRDLTRGKMKHWVPDLGLPSGKHPVSIMTGICGYDMYISNGDGHFHLKSQFQGTMENGVISSGADSSTQARYIEAMYIAILEN